jgi:hypothetical protein
MKLSGSLKAYVKDVRAVQWFICAIPLGGKLLQKQSVWGFPPLGSNPGTYVFLTIVLAGIAAILPLAVPQS